MQNATKEKAATIGEIFNDEQFKTAFGDLLTPAELMALPFEEFIDARTGALPGNSGLGAPACSETVAAEIAASLAGQNTNLIVCYGWQLDSPSFWGVVRVNGELVMSPAAWEYFLADEEAPKEHVLPGFSIHAVRPDGYGDVTTLLLVRFDGQKD